MLQKKLKDINVAYNESTKEMLGEIYKTLTWLDVKEFRKVVLEDVTRKKADAEAKGETFDMGYLNPIYIDEKTWEAFQVALSQYKKDHNIDVYFEETYDEQGNSILEFGVTKVIEKFHIPMNFSHKMQFGKMVRKQIVEDDSSKEFSI